MSREKIVVLDFGSQYAHLIAKRFRMLGYYSEIALPSADVETLAGAKGIVFSGGPASVYDENTPDFNSEILNLDIPILGLCYGHYIVQLGYNGKVGKADVGEFGFAELNFNDGMNGSAAKCPLFKGVEGSQQVWMRLKCERPSSTISRPGRVSPTVSISSRYRRPVCRH